MITRLELSNYRGFNLLRTELAPVTVVIGSNASGKSTLLEAVHVVMTSTDASVRFSGPLPPSSRTLEPVVLESVASDVAAIFARKGTSISPEFSVAADFDGNMLSQVRLTVRASEYGSLAVDLELSYSGPSGYGSKPFLAGGPSAAMVRHVSTIPNEEPFRSDSEVERLALGGLQSAILRNRLLRLDSAGLESINRVLRNLANAEIIMPPVINESVRPAPLAIQYRRNGSTHEIGSGNHALISMASLLAEVETCLSRPSATGERILLLDEPELHLHPKAQAGLAAHLADRARASKAQIVFVTHSADIANRLVSCTDTALLAFERPFSKPRRLDSQKELLEALTRTHDLTQFASLNFLESRRVLFCEGETDKALLQQCALVHFHSTPERYARFEAWMVVASEGVENMPAIELIERLVSSPLLPRLPRSEALVVMAVCDRDYVRQPGRYEHSGKQVERIHHVWSRHSIESLFVEVAVLSSVLAALLGEDAPADLETRIRDAIAAADSDDDLLEAAEDELADEYRRTGQYRGKAAQKEARKVVRANPEIWQNGKERAAVVLRDIRGGLPAKLQNKIRASVAKLFKAIPRESLKSVALPGEITELLNFLAERA